MDNGSSWDQVDFWLNFLKIDSFDQNKSKIDLWFFWNNFFRDGMSWPKSVSIRKIIFEMQ